MWLQIGHLSAHVCYVPDTRIISRRVSSMERPANVHDNAQHRNALIIANNSWNMRKKWRKNIISVKRRSQKIDILYFMSFIIPSGVLHSI